MVNEQLTYKAWEWEYYLSLEHKRLWGGIITRRRAERLRVIDEFEQDNLSWLDLDGVSGNKRGEGNGVEEDGDGDGDGDGGRITARRARRNR